ncbi:copper resistance protein CopC [Brevibacterium sp.]|uniref:copper resistance CopC family protein n=1 Tax=Brevibacterium sp. TaxID=1701 RepID=UPI0028128C5F|nr:copper resistance protein CopC [Brevibacterium sp.]
MTAIRSLSSTSIPASPHFRPFRRPHGATRPVLAAIALVMAMIWLASTPALAHDQLITETPSNGDSVKSAPDAVTMEFSGSPQKLGNEIDVLHDGQNIATGSPEVQFHTVTQKLRTDLPSGDYTVKWRIVSEDGHPVSGDFTFTVEDDSSTGTAQPSTTSTAGSPTESAARDAASQTPTLVFTILGAAIIVIVASFLVAVAIRMRRQRH